MCITQEPIPAATYNRIPFLREQPLVPPDLLRDLGQLFARHQLVHQWGVGVVHRHSDILPGCVMVHRQAEDHTDICEPRSLQSIPSSELIPMSLLLNKEQQFQAYEYELGSQRLLPPLEFLHELRDLLVSRRSENIVCLTAMAASGLKLVHEVLVLNDLGLVRSMRSKPGQPHKWTGTTTNWVFCDGVEIRAIGVKACRMLATGLHEVTKDA